MSSPHFPLLCAAVLAVSLLSGCEPPPAPAAPSSAPSEAGPATADTAQPLAKPDLPPINFAGFGPAHFGDDEESVRMAWGRDLQRGQSADGASCYYLTLLPKPQDHQGIAFMLEQGKFVRYDVDGPEWSAPGNIVVGDEVAKVKAAHLGRLVEDPHKYLVGGRTLTITPADGSPARLVFEVDADGKVINWRIGLPPQVYYVEGCG